MDNLAEEAQVFTNQLDINPDDWSLRAIWSDWLEDHNYNTEAYTQRWMLRWKRRPVPNQMVAYGTDTSDGYDETFLGWAFFTDRFKPHGWYTIPRWVLNLMWCPDNQGGGNYWNDSKVYSSRRMCEAQLGIALLKAEEILETGLPLRKYLNDNYSLIRPTNEIHFNFLLEDTIRSIERSKEIY
jgi:hypothetical protein